MTGMIGHLVGRMAWVVLLLPACAPRSAWKPDRAEPVREQTEVSRAEIPDPPQQTAVRQPIRFTESRQGGVLLRGVVFDAREYRMLVVDQAGGPGSQFADAGSVARAFGGVAAANAGFFTPEGKPLGLVVAEGRSAGSWNSISSLGSALWQESAAGRMSIVRRSADARAAGIGARNLLQSGPLLVERRRAVHGLDDSKASARTYLLWDGGERWWMGTASPVTLAGLARVLVSDPPVDWQPWMALNLDGGRSSDLWVSPGLAGRETTTRMPWNRTVRNFLVLMPVR